MYTVVVESPAKAKTINKYLGKDYTVLASFGHVRDLPSKDGSVRPEDDFAMTYEVDNDSKKQISAIAAAAKGADILYLATDPDREGEAISWHVVEALRERKALNKKTEIKRIVFHEITKNAILHAVENPRDIDMDLVNAQQARRALDYLVGFNLSPVLWRKLPGAKSAGRVQSVALRLICDRDSEIEAFVSQEYWDISALMGTAAKETIPARLTYWKGTKLEKFSFIQGEDAHSVVAALQGSRVKVASVTPKQMRRNPYPPFTTSTLQMDASRKLGFGAKKTMQIAQKLYEGLDIGGETVGLITYMRTDGVTVSTEAITAARKHISGEYGQHYMPKSPRVYTVKTKNAQEAHEAIRPTDIDRTPFKMRAHLNEDMFKLYDLIWKRMVASQMESAVYDQVVVEMEEPKHQATFRANGSILKFDGFLTLYRQGMDDDDKETDENRLLPPLEVGQMLDINELKAEQHFTEPPPRYSEASLVKRLEELGIGRPSTYASIISVLQDRGYVRLDKKRFIAEMRGRLVSAFLSDFFRRYVEYDFTANLENELDEIAEGKRDWKAVLHAFWNDFLTNVTEAKGVGQREILDALDKDLASFIFGKREVTEADRLCPTCNKGTLNLRTGKFGAFLGCSNYPDCNHTKQLGDAGESSADGQGDGSGAPADDLPRELGSDPATGQTVWLKRGPYGVYVQLGEEQKPKRTSLPRGLTASQVDLSKALSLLSLPRELGNHPETGKKIVANIGRFGPYIQHDGGFTSLKGDDDVLTIGMNRAVDLIAETSKKKTIEPLRVLGVHPEDNGEIAVYDGRYGAYVKHGKTNATLGKGDTPESITLEQAIALIAARAASAPAAKGKKAPAKKAASTTEKKAAAPKKAAPKKASSTKKAPAKKK